MINQNTTTWNAERNALEEVVVSAQNEVDVRHLLGQLPIMVHSHVGDGNHNACALFTELLGEAPADCHKVVVHHFFRIHSAQRHNPVLFNQSHDTNLKAVLCQT